MKGSQVYTERSKGMFSQKNLRNESKNSILIMHHYPKLGSCISKCFRLAENLLQLIKRTGYSSR